MKSQRFRSAFTLVEVTLALGLASFCLVAIFGLLPSGVNSNRDAREQTAAINFLTAVTADLREAGASPKTSVQYGLAVPGAGGSITPSSAPIQKYLSEDGQVVASASSARYRLSVWMMPPPADSRQVTAVRLLLSWPPTAEISNAAGSVETVIALDRN